MAKNNSAHLLGEQGEELVASYITQQGFSVLARNYRCKMGEVDIIAANTEYVLFIEVKSRSQEYFPIPTVVTPAKQNKVIFAARHFLMKHCHEGKVYRFDVATVVFADAAPPVIDYIPDAFRV